MPPTKFRYVEVILYYSDSENSSQVFLNLRVIPFKALYALEIRSRNHLSLF